MKIIEETDTYIKYKDKLWGEITIHKSPDYFVQFSTDSSLEDKKEEKRAQSIYDYVDSKAVKIKELEELFTKEKEISIDMLNFKGCPNCDDRCNQTTLEAESWTSAMHCRKCDSMILIIYTDRMGGWHKDTVVVFK